MTTNYTSSSGTVRLFSQTYGRPFDLNTAQIVGLQNDTIAVISGGVPFVTAGHRNDVIAANVSIVSSVDYSVLNEFTIYDQSGIPLPDGAWPPTKFQDALWSNNGTLFVSFGQYANSAGTLRTPEQVIEMIADYGSGVRTTQTPFPFDDVDWTSESHLTELQNGNVLAVVRTSQTMEAQIYDASGEPVRAGYFLTSHRPDIYNNFGTQGLFGPLTIRKADRIISWEANDYGIKNVFFVVVNKNGRPKSETLTVVTADPDDNTVGVSSHELVRLKGGGFALVWLETPRLGWIDSVTVKMQIVDRHGEAIGQVQTLDIADSVPGGYASMPSQLSVQELDHGAFSVIWQSDSTNIAFFNNRAQQLGETQALPGSELFYSYTMLDGTALPSGDIALFSATYGGSRLHGQMETIQVDIDFASTSRDDWRLGTAFNDRIAGKGGNDLLEGFGGQDVLRGGIGSDTLTGGNGNDTLIGNGGIDTLNGGNQDDILRGDGGDDLLTGGNGADIFVFAGSMQGTDQIMDFEIGIDTIQIAGGSFSALEISDTVDGATIVYDQGTIIAHGVTAAELTAGNFDFA